MTVLKKYLLSVLLLLATAGTSAFAQDASASTAPATAPAPAASPATIDMEDRQMLLQVSRKIRAFISELEEISDAIPGAPSDVYPDINRRYNSAKLRWNTYYQSYQGFIADHERLMQEVADYGQVDEALVAAMTELKSKMDAQTEFRESVGYIESQDSLYIRMFKQANALSMSQRTQSELEKLKGKEQLLFAEIQEKYDKAKAAVELVPSLQPEMDKLEDHFIVIKNTSAKIQEAAYKPFIQRIKDYLLGLAAVAVVLMFISMMQSKLKAAKQLKENAKQMMEGLGKKDDDYPCI
ncbi:MAG: hypothetical protein Q4F39_02080 [Bacteroidia bacterium]|nr:hypothetical protein [Bacteroidia bacterium]